LGELDIDGSVIIKLILESYRKMVQCGLDWSASR